MLLLEKTQGRVDASGLVLKREELSTLLDAAELIEAAKAEAAAIRQQAIKDYDAEKQRGYEEGLEKGRAEMSEKMVEQMTQSARYFSNVEDTLIEVVMRALRRIIGEMEDREVVERTVKRALESTRRKGNVTVRVPPVQADALQERLDQILKAFPKLEFIEIVPDNRLPENGCILETEVGVINATLENQLKAIEKALISSMK